MIGAARYQRGQSMRVRIDGHSEPVQMVSIERPEMCAGGGLLLVIDRGDGAVDRLVSLLNDGAQADKLRDVLRLVADEPNIDRARAMADAVLAG